MAEVPEEVIRVSRSVVFRSCSRDQVRMMLEAAGPMFEAAQRERDAALVRDMARNAVPGMARRWLYRAAKVIEGKSSDGEGAGHG